MRLRLASANTIRSTQGLESESPLAFAALHRLLRPVLDLLERLPEPQTRALGVAFSQEAGTVEPFLVAVATLSMLTEAAEEQPLVCVVDDAHWLDSASADALLFATRRLEADPVAVVFAARDTDDRTFCSGQADVVQHCGDMEQLQVELHDRPGRVGDAPQVGADPPPAGRRHCARSKASVLSRDSFRRCRHAATDRSRRPGSPAEHQGRRGGAELRLNAS